MPTLQHTLGEILSAPVTREFVREILESLELDKFHCFFFFSYSQKQQSVTGTSRKVRSHTYACLMFKKSIFVLSSEKLAHKIAQELLLGVKSRPRQERQSQRDRG